ncbi:neutral zinc metallopeptidase [Egicoccus sp. AB-alg6-2]|uniref:KPN_02809 family neutral zinc metallopeptidase n=1 Tax=Egicoccus sp. AB-alg6-2 TaxID=3242692 RepID=UPI00359EC5DE
MSFNDDVRIDSGRASRGRRGGAGVAIGGGGGLLLLLLALVFDIPLDALAGGGDPGAGSAGGQEIEGGFEHCQTGADANEHVDCRIIATAESLDVVWEEQLPAAGGPAYEPPGLTIFEGQVATGCGTATSQVGPFYCPADRTTYFDTGFFDTLRERFGAGEGPLAEQFVVAHEFGHHIEHQLGLLDRAQRDPSGPESGAVRVELMADCLSGVWAHHATQALDPESGEAFLRPLTEDDIADALSAAAAVGDDRIQERVQGQVTPETFTHGTSEQRQSWFSRGYREGELAACDTFATDEL